MSEEALALGADGDPDDVVESLTLAPIAAHTAAENSAMRPLRCKITL